jgi:hypothetical protein
MRTKSLWGSPPSRFYNFLRRVERVVKSRPIKISILGCADGKFVLPCTRRGYKVLAVDMDEIAIYGGYKVGPEGDVYMEGVLSRLRIEGLESFAEVIHADFVEFIPNEKFHAVFTSGAINYSYNTKHELHAIIEKICSYVADGGLIYFDYMLPMMDKEKKKRYYFKKGELKSYFKTPAWDVLFDRVLPPLLEKAHVDMPIDHYHHWGHLCVQKQKSVVR